MNKILSSIKQRKINLILMVTVLFLYLINNMHLKKNTSGHFRCFFICYFNDLICPLFFISYCNILLITINKEMVKLRWILLLGFCAGLIWEYIGPIIKPSSVKDYLDLVCYMIGSVLYWVIIKLSHNDCCKMLEKGKR